MTARQLGAGRARAPALTITPDGAVTLALTGLPTAHSAAGAPYHLEIHRGTPGAAAEQRATVPVLTPDLVWTDRAPVPRTRTTTAP
ncbi:hypothetical protein [Streptomyces sp. B6B3]|uniref:hypothetical protein n=1 Tax=Streptomyces sp. B6B3 TaxID=3153570 RepID=UPI00325D6623